MDDDTRRNYYNTTNESGATLTRSKSRASHQDDVVLAIFQQRPDVTLAPHEVLEISGASWPLTSVRRSINTLTKRGLLQKTAQQVMGTYDKPVYTWRLRAQ